MCEADKDTVEDVAKRNAVMTSPQFSLDTAELESSCKIDEGEFKMKKSKFTEEQIPFALHQAETAASIVGAQSSLWEEVTSTQ